MRKRDKIDRLIGDVLYDLHTCGLKVLGGNQLYYYLLILIK